MVDYARVVEFIHELYDNSEFVPLNVPKFIGNEKRVLTSKAVLIQRLRDYDRWLKH